MDMRDIFVADWLPEDANGYNSRMVFGRDGMIYVSNGASNSDSAQDPKEFIVERSCGYAMTAHGSAGGSSLRGTRWLQTGDLLHGTSQHALGLIVQSGDGGRCGITRTVPMAAMKSTSSCRAGTTAGRLRVMAGPTKDPGYRTFHGAKGSNSHSCSGCRRSRSRAWRCIRVIASLRGRTMFSSAACARVKFRVRGTWSGSCSTTRPKSFIKRPCSPEHVADPRRSPGPGRAAVSVDGRARRVRC